MYHKKSYPWIADKVSVSDAVYEICKNYVVGKASGFAASLISATDDPKTLSEISKYLLHKTLLEKSKGTAAANEAKINSSFPKVGSLLDFLDGSSELKVVYTGEFDGKQVPIYLAKDEEAEPTDDELKKAIEHVKGEKRSPYQDSGYRALNQFYRENFSSPGLDVLLNEDTAKDAYVPDPSFIKDWVVRDEIGDLAGGGIEDKTYERTAYGVKVRRFYRQSKFDIFLRWSARDLAYDFFDYLIYAPIKAAVHLFAGTSLATQKLVKDNYKGATLLARGVVGSGVVFDLRSEEEKKKKAAKNAA